MSYVKNKLIKEVKKLSRYKIINMKHLYKYWERCHLERLLAHFEVDCVFDIGANNGQYARRLRKDIGFEGIIIYFEPNPEAVVRLKEAAKNDPLWEVEQIAISNKSGKQSFNIMEAD